MLKLRTYTLSSGVSTMLAIEEIEVHYHVQYGKGGGGFLSVRHMWYMLFSVNKTDHVMILVCTSTTEEGPIGAEMSCWMRTAYHVC